MVSVSCWKGLTHAYSIKQGRIIHRVLIPRIRNTAGAWVERRLGTLHLNWTIARDAAPNPSVFRDEANAVLAALERIQVHFQGKECQVRKQFWHLEVPG